MAGRPRFDPGLVLRLLRRAERPGLVSPAQARAIHARHLGMVTRPALAERLGSRGRVVGEASAAIVYARPVEGGAAAPARPTVPAVRLRDHSPTPVLRRRTVAGSAPAAVPPLVPLSPAAPGDVAGGPADGRDGTVPDPPGPLPLAGPPATATANGNGAAPGTAPADGARAGAAGAVPGGPSSSAAPPAPMVTPPPVPEAAASPAPGRTGPAARAAGPVPGPAAPAELPLVRGRPVAPAAVRPDAVQPPIGPGGAALPGPLVLPLGTGPVTGAVTGAVPALPAVPGVADLAGPPGPAVRVPAPGAAGAPLPAGPLPGVLPVVTEPAPAGAPATAARRFLPLPAAVAPAAAPAHRAAAGPASRPAAVGREPQPPGGRRERGGDGHGVDVDRLTDMVQARLLRRLAIERERRGR